MGIYEIGKDIVDWEQFYWVNAQRPLPKRLSSPSPTNSAIIGTQSNLEKLIVQENENDLILKVKDKDLGEDADQVAKAR